LSVRETADSQQWRTATALELTSVCAAPWGAPLLDQISLCLAAGQVLGLVGPNGAGKSSLLRLVAGDILPVSGRLTIGERERPEWNRQALARRLAYLPQLSLLNFPYTVEEVVALGRMPHATGRKEDARIINEAMTATDTAGLRHRHYTRLSGGERQRVQLARVFAQVWDVDSSTGALLLLDEPTTALDLSHQQLVLETVRQLAARGCAVVLAIHDFNLIAGHADRIAVMQAGRLVADAAPAEVFTPALFREVFAIDVIIQRHPDRDQPLVISR
jgi:iron complex transport system ATP-binding protein